MTTTTVSTTAALVAALKVAQGGDTILLNPGSYAGMSLSSINPTGPVQIMSADLANKAVVNNFKTNLCSNLTFSGLEFATTTTDAAYYAYKVTNSHDIHFDSLNVHGSLDNNATNDTEAFYFTGCQNVSVTNCEMQQLRRGVVVGACSGMTISDNYLHDIRADGLSLSSSSGVTIQRNYFTNFRHLSGDHSDAIQFLTANQTVPSTDILIQYNVMQQGDGAVMQGVFMTDQVGTLPYANLSILDNLIIGGNWNGISCGHGSNVAVARNELLSLTGVAQTVWISLSNIAGGYATDNQTLTAISPPANSTDFTLENNTLNARISDGGADAISTWVATHTADQLPPFFRV